MLAPSKRLERKIIKANVSQVQRVNENPEYLIERNAELQQTIDTLRKSLEPLRNIGMTPTEAVALIEELQSKLQTVGQGNTPPELGPNEMLINGIACTTQKEVAGRLKVSPYVICRVLKKLSGDLFVTAGKRKYVKVSAIPLIQKALPRP